MKKRYNYPQCFYLCLLSGFTSVYSTLFGGALCLVGPTHNCGTQLWSVGNYITYSWFLWIKIIFAIAYVWICYVHSTALQLITLIVASLTCVHDSLAHLYMPQPFTHCLPAIICVMWLLCMWFNNNVSVISATLHSLMYIIMFFMLYVPNQQSYNYPWTLMKYHYHSNKKIIQ